MLSTIGSDDIADVSTSPPADPAQNNRDARLPTRAADGLPASARAPADATAKARRARSRKLIAALRTPLELGADAERIAGALVPVMLSIVRDRPDLARAPFDFALRDRTIRITSVELNDDDRNWLERRLNGSNDLLRAVHAFHDDAVDGYLQAAEGLGQPLAQSERDAVSRQADRLVAFMTLFGRLGAEMASSLSRAYGEHSTLRDANGTRIDLARAPDNAIGFVAFMQGARAIADGAAFATKPDGTTIPIESRPDLFHGGAIPTFFPPDLYTAELKVIA